MPGGPEATRASHATLDESTTDGEAPGQGEEHRAPRNAMGRPEAASASSARCPSATQLRQEDEARCNAARNPRAHRQWG
eukprot:3724634-Alexandrium_andersonii.AAC.1